MAIPQTPAASPEATLPPGQYYPAGAASAGSDGGSGLPHPDLLPYARIRTGRLVLRMASAGSAEELCGLMHPRAAQRLASWPWPLSPEAARGIVTQSATDMAARKGLAWVMLDRATGRPVGWIGARLNPAVAAGLALLTYWVGLEFEGRGLAAEAAAAVVRPILQWTGAAGIGACIHADNARSIGVAARLGLRDLGLRPLVWSETRKRHELALCFVASRATLETFEQPTVHAGVA